MRYNVELYEKVDGKTPVLEFILDLNPKQQAKIYREIDLLEKFGMNYIILMWILLRVKNIKIYGN
jgi:hypothetical protein